MIFIPREGEELPSIEEKGNKIVLKTKQSSLKAFEITSPSAKSLADYEPLLNAANASKGEGELVLQSVDWVKKKNCAIVITEGVDQVLASVPGGPSALTVTEVVGQPYILTSEYVTDRFEFEGLADLITGCVKEGDLFYLCFDWAAKKNLMVFSTKDPGDRQKCLIAQDIFLEPA